MAEYDQETVNRAYDFQWKEFLEAQLEGKNKEEQKSKLEMFLAGSRFSGYSWESFTGNADSKIKVKGIGFGATSHYLAVCPQTREYLLSKLEEFGMHDDLELIEIELKAEKEMNDTAEEFYNALEKLDGPAVS